MKAFLEIGSATVTLIGVVIGAYGTYLLAGWIQPMGWWDYNISVVVMLWRILTFQTKKNEQVEEAARGLAQLEEDKQQSLHGLGWIFLGFLFQSIGALMLLFDTYLVNFVEKCK